MRIRAMLAVSCASALAAGGCSVDVLHYGAKNLVYTPCSRLNGAKECCRSNTLAEESWRAFQKNSPGTQFSKDFASGYVFGFADYVEKGGSGNPPVVPPLRYRKVHYETPEGHQQIADWFAGCRAGAAAGMASGYRQNVILPMVVPPPKPDKSEYVIQMQQMHGMIPHSEHEPTLPSPTPVERVPAPGPPPDPPPPAPIPAPLSSVPAPVRSPSQIPTNPLLHGAAPAGPAPASSGTQAQMPAPRPAPGPLTPPLPVPTSLESREGAAATGTPAAVSDASQRLAGRLDESRTDDRRLLKDLAPVEVGVWVPTRNTQRPDAGHGNTATPEKKAVAGGTGSVPVAARTVHTDASLPATPADDAGVIVSHRGARWQN